MKQWHMIIDGQAVQTETASEVINPATGKAFARVSSGDTSHVDQAVAAARKAFPAWRQTPVEERRQALHRLAELLEKHEEELKECITLETGKPLEGLNGVGAGRELLAAGAALRATAELELPVEVLADDEQVRIEMHHKPLGVTASITPWNWPLVICTWHFAPALLTGNTVVLKPSPFTPLTTLRFVELANEILPPGVLNAITGEREVGEALTRHPGIDKVVFTGSIPTGKHIMEAAAGDLKRLTLELGGNDAGIVLPDVDVKEIAPKIFGACFHNNGQTCVCLKRLYVHEDIYEEMCEELARLAKSVKVGNGMDRDAELGPIQNHQQLQIICELVEDARRKGGRFIAGGQQIEGEGYFFEPTIVADLSDGVRLVDEEPFGPVLPIIRYADIDEVIERANNSPNGLGGSVWSGDPGRAAELALRLECGTTWVNEHGALQPDVPFGGAKQSGIGVEFGRRGLEEYTAMQILRIRK